MGRLINAEEFKNHIKEVIKKQNGKNIDLVPVGELLVFIDREPTAYDLDEVVKQLEAKVKEYDARIERRKGACVFDETEKMKALDERARGIEVAIDIVKAGGVDG